MNKAPDHRRAPLTAAALRRAAGVLRLLAHPDRLRVIALLDAEGPAPVHRISGRLRRGQAATSHHLARMKRLGLVAAERRGQEVWYGIADRRTITILDCIRKQGGGR